MIQTKAKGLKLEVNGSVLAVARRPLLAELEPALRGIALSDSPVLVRADPFDADHVVQRLHVLSRRAELPLQSVHHERDVTSLLGALGKDGEACSEARGTWALHHVHWWSMDRQLDLAALLEDLDTARLHGRLGHHHIPRIVVVSGLGERLGKLEPTLEQRLTFFHLTISPNLEKGLH
jgi:hypothetical protein